MTEGPVDDLDGAMIPAHRINGDAHAALRAAPGSGAVDPVVAGRNPADWVTASAGVVRSAHRLGRDDEAALVIAAVGADVVGQLQLVAVRTLLELRQADRLVSAALTLAGVRHASLRHTHGFVGSF